MQRLDASTHENLLPGAPRAASRAFGGRGRRPSSRGRRSRRRAPSRARQRGKPGPAPRPARCGSPRRARRRAAIGRVRLVDPHRRLDEARQLGIVGALLELDSQTVAPGTALRAAASRHRASAVAASPTASAAARPPRRRLPPAPPPAPGSRAAEWPCPRRPGPIPRPVQRRMPARRSPSPSPPSADGAGRRRAAPPGMRAMENHRPDPSARPPDRARPVAPRPPLALAALGRVAPLGELAGHRLLDGLSIGQVRGAAGARADEVDLVQREALRRAGTSISPPTRSDRRREAEPVPAALDDLAERADRQPRRSSGSSTRSRIM